MALWNIDGSLTQPIRVGVSDWHFRILNLNPKRFKLISLFISNKWNRNTMIF